MAGKQAIRGLRDVVTKPPRADPFRALAGLLEKPWWSGAWIVQEFILAKRLLFLCGSEIIQHEAIETLVARGTDAAELVESAISPNLRPQRALLLGSPAWRNVSDMVNLRIRCWSANGHDGVLDAL